MSNGAHKDFYTEHLAKIEAVASTLLQTQFESVQDLWKMEHDLIKHLIELQRHVAETTEEKDKLTGSISVSLARGVSYVHNVELASKDTMAFVEMTV